MITYEWDLEEMDGDSIEHHHSDKFKNLPENVEGEICLVRDSDDDRSWAYLKEDGTLPEYFANSFGVEIAKVPKKFHKEIKN